MLTAFDRNVRIDLPANGTHPFKTGQEKLSTLTIDPFGT